MAAEDRRPLSREDYLALERRGEGKHEYIAGDIIAMVGASFRHNLIQTRVLAGLYNQLRGRPCEVAPSDLRVAVAALDIYTYPDVTVVCGNRTSRMPSKIRCSTPPSSPKSFPRQPKATTGG